MPMVQWFKGLSCPSCTAVLEVRLPEGTTSVRCGECSHTFAVRVEARPLMPPKEEGGGRWWWW